MLPELPVDDFLTSIEELVTVDAAWVPDAHGGEASLYLRPFMFANESFLGVRAAHQVTYSVSASPVGPYFAGGVKPVNIWVTDAYSRAGKGGISAEWITYRTAPLSIRDQIEAISEDTVRICADVRNTAQTGVEMEALTACSVAALTIYDMAKAVDPGMWITDIGLMEKAGGKRGVWTR